MPQQILNVADADAARQQMRRETVAQRVGDTRLSKPAFSTASRIIFWNVTSST